MHTPQYDDTGRVVRTVVERESDFDEEQLQYLAALYDYEKTINEFGIPIADATSRDADPGNSQGSHYYRADSLIDWAAFAVAEHLKSKGTQDPYRSARRVRVTRVDRN